MAIIALGVGFFSGLKMTKPDMMNTISNFLDKGNFYDLILILLKPHRLCHAGVMPFALRIL